MEQTSSDAALMKVKARDSTVDKDIERMATRRLADVVQVSEFIKEDGRQGVRTVISLPRGESEYAADFLVCRMFTDAIFNEDIRTIQLIVNRIDGASVRDVDMDDYSTQFSDCFAEIMNMKSSEQIKLLPDDTVMMALCKSLYAMAVQDIYWDPVRQCKCRPSTDKKQERDAARKMVLERTGGRKTATMARKEHEEIEEADWVKNLSLPA